MDTRLYWERFIKSGSISDYLKFSNARKENEIGENGRDTFYNGSTGYKRDERRGE